GAAAARDGGSTHPGVAKKAEADVEMAVVRESGSGNGGGFVCGDRGGGDGEFGTSREDFVSGGCERQNDFCKQSQADYACTALSTRHLRQASTWHGRLSCFRLGSLRKPRE